MQKKEKILDEQLKKLEHLYQNGVREISMQSNFFDVLDKKSLWVFTIISITQFYIFENYFTKIKDFGDENNFSIYSVLVFGLILQILFLTEYKGKKLAIGPGIEKQIKFGKIGRSFFDLALDSVSALRKSVIFNKNVLDSKTKIFGYLMYGIYTYYTFLFIFLIIYNKYVR